MDSLFVFRRDIRAEDNTGFYAALRESDKVIPCFIFDPAQVEENEYISHNALQFMFDSLRDLDEQLGGMLCLFYGRPEKAVEELLDSSGASAVYCNRDYTPFARERDSRLEKTCRKNDAVFKQFGDCLLSEPEEVLKADGRPYTVFTPFFRKAGTLKVRRPEKMKGGDIRRFKGNISLSQAEKRFLPERNRDLKVSGGRKNAEKILSGIADFRSYGKTRDLPSLDSTTHLSAHLKFGTCSVREAYHAITGSLGEEHPLIRQLCWRDFFTHIGYHFPRVYGSSFKEKYERIEWSYDKEKFGRWQAGKTGFPLVDAGMRELAGTGFMHNRVRMITASFLVKDLHIDWRWGEKHFAQKLVDYDPAVNNGNWQWSASTGCDAQPYFRVFNPWMQQKKYDPECRYIKKWVPELTTLSAKEIHGLEKKTLSGLDYPPPMVDHIRESEISKAAFASMR